MVEPIRNRAKLKSLPAGFWGMTIAHLGIGLFALGVTGVESYRIERDISLGAGETTTLQGYEFRFEGTREVQGPNYRAVEGTVVITRDGKQVTTLRPQKRYYASGGNPMTEAGIRASLKRDLFVALGEDLGKGAWSLRIYHKPFVRWLWLGGLIMAIGAGLAATDRRYRTLARRAGQGATDTAEATA